jgi:integration host factor subunit beta
MHKPKQIIFRPCLYRSLPVYIFKIVIDFFIISSILFRIYGPIHYKSHSDLLFFAGDHHMNKSDLITALVIKEKLTEVQSSEIVNLIFDGFTDTLMKGGRIEIRGFGSFTMREYGGYTGRNPRTGKKVDVKPKRSPFFKAGKELKKMVDG